MKKKSNHFDGRRYYNPTTPERSFWEIVRWMWKRRRIKSWPWISVEQQKVQQERTQKGECVITFINHSSVLIQLDGWNILTDPIWSNELALYLGLVLNGSLYLE